MPAKFILSFFAFAFLIVINFFIAGKILAKNHRLVATQKILAEIDNSYTKVSESNSAPLVLDTIEANVTTADGRAANLKNFFRKYNSPLYDEADYIVEISDKYQFDYRLLPAIAMQESNLCKFIPADSFNCWGWGIYGNTITKFKSYKEAIQTVAEGLRTNYIDKGLVTATSIMSKYNPSSPNGSWAHGVNVYLNILE